LAFTLGFISPPPLVVVVIFDQFRYDYITRLYPYFRRDGFRRLIERGAFFTQCHHVHIPTYTAPGHATISTGTVPRFHGIVGNVWYDTRTSERVYAVSDPAAEAVGGKYRWGESPKNLLANTVGDELKLKTGFRGKVISLSLKDRAAILMGGHLADMAVWFSTEDGHFITSSYYTADAPAWLKDFNSKRLPGRYFGRTWRPYGPPEAYASAGSGSFSHHLGTRSEVPDRRFFRELKATPFGNDLLLELLKAAVVGESLGRDDIPDLLLVSFSANDYVGHKYGPHSAEVVDMVLRSDSIVAEMLRFLDRRVGRGRYVLVLTSDHGVAPVPETLSSRGMLAGRLSYDTVRARINSILTAKFGEGDWVLSVSLPWVYLNDTLLSKHGSLREIRRLLKDSLMEVEGVLRVFTREDMEEGRFPPEDMVARLAYNGFNPERSGDLIIIPKAFYVMGNYAATNHGTPYTYDTHVPLIFYGRGIRRGTHSAPCATTSIAPTVSAILWSESPAYSASPILEVK